MSQKDKTQMGGRNEAFCTTQWTEILNARTEDSVRRREATGAIAGHYWKPVYAYLRRKGNENEKAKDLTQGFFEAVVLGRGLIQAADRKKGRFRTFLLTALDRYVTSTHRAETAKKRMPAGGLVSLDGLETPVIPEPSPQATPEEAFTYAWASQLLDEVLAAVEEGCLRAGQKTHWQVFRLTVVEPILSGAEAPPLARLCRELGIKSEAKASNMNVTVKRRFKTTLNARIREFVSCDEDIEREIRELMDILSHCGASS